MADLALSLNALYLSVGPAILVVNIPAFTAILVTRLCYKDNKHIFVAGLAFSDILLGLTLIIKGLIHFSSKQTPEAGRDPGLSCFLQIQIINLTLVATIGYLLALTVDQYLHLALPLRYPVIAGRKFVVTLLVLAWSLPLGNVALCAALWDFSQPCNFFDNMPWGYNMFLLFGDVVIPLMVILILHGLCLRIALRHRREVKALTSVQRSEGTHASRSQWRGLVTTGLIVGVLLVTWLPMGLSMAIYLIAPSVLGQHIYLTVTVTSGLYICKSLLNPLMYSLRVAEIKQFLLGFCSSCCLQKGNQSTEHVIHVTVGGVEANTYAK